MTTPTTRIEKIAGLLLILGLVGWAAGLLARGRAQDWFHRRPMITFALGDAHGLVVGDRVRMSGVAIGSVRSVRLSEDRIVTVTLEILPEHAGRLREGLRAEVVPPSFLGGTEVVLIPGLGEELLPPGSRIPAEVKPDTTESFGPLMDRLTALGENLEAITRGLREGEGSLGALLRDGGEMHAELMAVLKEGRGTLEEFRRLGEKSTEAAGDVGEVLARLKEEMDDVYGLLEQISRVTGEIESLAGTIARREEGIPATIEEARLMLRDLREAIRQVSEELPEAAASARLTTDEARRLIRATERNFLIRPHLEPLPEMETTISGSRRWDPYED